MDHTLLRHICITHLVPKSQFHPNTATCYVPFPKSQRGGPVGSPKTFGAPMPTEGIFGKDFVANGRQQVFGVKFLSKSSMNFLADGPATCSAARSRRSLPRRVAWPGHITSIAAPCLSTSPCRQIDPVYMVAYAP